MRVPENAVAGSAILRVTFTSEMGKQAGPDDLTVQLVEPEPKKAPEKKTEEEEEE